MMIPEILEFDDGPPPHRFITVRVVLDPTPGDSRPILRRVEEALEADPELVVMRLHLEGE